MTYVQPFSRDKRGGGGSSLDDAEAFWNMEEASGTRFDQTTNNHDLTDNNTVGQAAGIVDQAANFVAATDEYLSEADTAGLSAGNIDMSFSIWVYPNALLANKHTFSKIGTINANKEYVLLMRLATGAMRFDWFTDAVGNKSSAQATDLLTAATWNYIFCYHDATANEIGISINDGTIVTTAATGGNDGAAEFRIARENSTSNDWDGRVDAFGVWRRRITAAEVTDLYNAGSGKQWPL